MVRVWLEFSATAHLQARLGRHGETLFGYTREEAIGTDLDELAAAHDSIRDEAVGYTGAVEAYPDLMDNQGLLQATTKRTRKDGSLVDVELSGLPVIVAGEEVAIIAIYHDIGPLQEAGREVEAANQAKSTFLANMSHELRTYAAEYPGQPDRVFDAVNQCILHDTSVLQFVTVFYGILELATGRLLYSNAGHCPAYLFRAGDRQHAQQLSVTGAALGLIDDMSWTRESVQLDAGDLLVLYTDGITEAHNEQKKVFGDERLLTSIGTWLDKAGPPGTTARQVQDAILRDVLRFAGNAPQSDDIALAVLMRE